MAEGVAPAHCAILESKGAEIFLLISYDHKIAPDEWPKGRPFPQCLLFPSNLLCHRVESHQLGLLGFDEDKQQRRRGDQIAVGELAGEGSALVATINAPSLAAIGVVATP